jgi:hypothetical protein
MVAGSAEVVMITVGVNCAAATGGRKRVSSPRAAVSDAVDDNDDDNDNDEAARRELVAFARNRKQVEILVRMMRIPSETRRGFYTFEAEWDFEREVGSRGNIPIFVPPASRRPSRGDSPTQPESWTRASARCTRDSR